MPAPAWCRDLNMLAFLGSLAVSVGGTCITLGGLASVQAFCLDAPPLLGLGAGFRITGVSELASRGAAPLQRGR